MASADSPRGPRFDFICWNVHVTGLLGMSTFHVGSWRLTATVRTRIPSHTCVSGATIETCSDAASGSALSRSVSWNGVQHVRRLRHDGPPSARQKGRPCSSYAPLMQASDIIRLSRSAPPRQRGIVRMGVPMANKISTLVHILMN